MKQIDKDPIQIIPAIGIFLFLFLGMIGGIYGVDESKNYFHQIRFILIFGLLGLASGLIFGAYIKPFLKLNRHQLNNYGGIKMFICGGFIGIMLALGNIINKDLSEFKYYDQFTVVKMSYREERFRVPEAFYLFVDIDGKRQQLICDQNYWDRIKVGNRITLSIYESKMGFDFIEFYK